MIGRPLLFLAAFLPLVFGGMRRAQAGDAGRFDFYVLSLTWSPGYCAVEGSNANRAECARRAGFLVHGLWPQYSHGYPHDCPIGSGGQLDRETARQLLDVMPSLGLVRHEWRKHGSCTGLSQSAYFATLRKAWSRVRIPQRYRSPAKPTYAAPATIEGAFRAANPGLDANEIAVVCRKRYLTEVRICLTKDLQFRPCPAVDRNGCRRPQVIVPSPGG